MSIKMKELPISERPYEKLEMYGSNSLSNAELLAIIIKTGTREESSVTIAQKILKLNKEQKDNLKFLQNISINELTKIKGIGKIKAIQLKAVAELNKRMSRPILDNKVKITCPQDVANLLIDELKNEKREIVKVLILNTKNIVDKILDVSYGTANLAIVTPKDVLAEAVKMEASFIDDLGADSLDIVELIMALEEEFDTEIPDADAEKIVTVGDVVDYIKDHVEQ